MAITTISRIQHRRGLKTDLPQNLNEGELGFCLDTNELFIGNVANVGGNTQILTTSNEIVQNIPYQYISDTDVVSQTGDSPNTPVVRTLQQQIDDYWVNVKAYGAIGNGINDDTAAINRALYDIYNKTLTPTENPLQARKSLWFPSGTYLVKNTILIGPQTRLVGESSATTVILLDNASATPSVIRLADSNGQVGTAMGQNGASLPNNILLQDLGFITTGGQDIAWLENCYNVTFERCVFKGTNPYNGSVTLAQKGVYLQNLTGTVFNNHFSRCSFQNLTYGVYSSDPVSNNTFDSCQFSTLYRGFDLNALAVGGGPQFTRVSSSVFNIIWDSGIYITATNPGIVSFGNSFTDCGQGNSVGAIYWASGTQDCASVADVFDAAPFVTGAIATIGTGKNFILDPQQQNINVTVNTPVANVRAIATTSAASYPMTDTSDVLVVLSPPCTVNLLTGSTLQTGQTVTIKDGAGTSETNPITISSSSAQIDDASSFILDINYGSITLVYDGTQWRVI